MSFFDDTIKSKWFRLVSSNIQGRISVFNKKYLSESMLFPPFPFENKLGDYYEGYRTLTKDDNGYCTGTYGGHGALMYFGKDGKYGRLGRGSYNFTGESPEPYFSNKVKKYLLKKETGVKGADGKTINVETNTKYNSKNSLIFKLNSTIPVYKSNAAFLYDGKRFDAYLYKNDYTIDTYYFKDNIDKYFEKPITYVSESEVYQDIIRPIFLNDTVYYDTLFISKLVPYFYSTNNENKLLNKAFRVGELEEKKEYDINYGYKFLTDYYSNDIKDANKLFHYDFGPCFYIIDNTAILEDYILMNGGISREDLPDYYWRHLKNSNNGLSVAMNPKNEFYGPNDYIYVTDFAIREPRVVVMPIDSSEYMKYNDSFIHIGFTVLEGDYIKSYRGIITGENCDRYLELLGGEAMGYCSYDRPYLPNGGLADYYYIDTKRKNYKNVMDLSIQPSLITKSTIEAIKSLCKKIQECDSLDLNNFYSYKYNKDLKYCIEEYDYISYQEHLKHPGDITKSSTTIYTEVDLYNSDFKVFNYFDDSATRVDTVTFNNYDLLLNTLDSKDIVKEARSYYGSYIDTVVYSTYYIGEENLPEDNFRCAQRKDYCVGYSSMTFFDKNSINYWFFEEEPLMSFPTNPGCMYYEEIAPGSESGFIKSDKISFPSDDIYKTEDGYITPDIDIEAGPKTEEIKQKIEDLKKEKEDILNDSSLTEEEKKQKLEEIDKKLEDAYKELEEEKGTSSGGVNTEIDVNLGLIIDENKLGDTKLPTDENGNEYIEIEIEVEVTDSNGVKRKIKKKVFLVNPRGKNNSSSAFIPIKDLIESYPASKVIIMVSPTDKDLIDSLIPEVDVVIKDTNNAITQDENSKKEPELTINGILDSLNTDDFFVIRKTRSRKNCVVWSDEVGISDDFIQIKNEENI